MNSIAPIHSDQNNEQSTTTQSAQNQSQALVPASYNVRETFGLDVPANAEIKGFAPSDHPAVPASNPNFVFKLDLLRELTDFLYLQSPDGMMLTGPTGCGKSSFVREYCARLKIPFYETSANARAEFDTFLGRWVIIEGNFNWVDGPLVQAFRDGGVFVINEIDTMNPDELTGFNGILDGSSLCLREKDGEIIHRHPDFKMIATGNSAGVGDDTGLYGGVKTMNMAFMDRFLVTKVDYMELEDELKILRAISDKVQWDDVLTEMLKVAHDVRAQFVEGKLNVTLSTRTMVRWATRALQLQTRRSASPVREAAYSALLNRVGETDRAVIEGLLDTHLSSLNA
ncbi:MAG: AAA family ATPase [Porticoccaceae bacterium]